MAAMDLSNPRPGGRGHGPLLHARSGAAYAANAGSFFFTATFFSVTYSGKPFFP